MNIAALSLKMLEPRRRAFEASTADPLKTQEKVLFEYLKRNRNTEYGRKYNFPKIRSIKDYQASVPLVDYEKIRPYIDRMASGEANVLTGDRVIFFGATSGTTAKPKLIPTTKYSEAQKQHLLNLWSSYIVKDHPEIGAGKILAIVSPQDEGRTPSGLLFGAESGHSYRALPGPILRLYSLPYQVFDIQDYEARHYVILRISMAQNITNIATLNPNTITLLCQKIERWQDLIIDDIEHGTLSSRIDIPGAIRKSIAKHLKPDPKRADELRSILKDKGKLLPKDFWPHLALVECWKGGMMRLYLKELDAYLGNIPKRDMGYTSTEALSSIPVSDENADGILAIQTNFYEFIPKAEIRKKARRILLCNELEKGGEYFIVVTTAGGLYRYNIDDIIKVTGFFNKTPMIEFVQKGLGATSLAGEKLYESHVNEAMSRALEKNRLVIEFSCAVARPDEGPRYVFLVEFSGDAPSDLQKKKLLLSIEEELCHENREYDFVRKAQLLKSPVLKVLGKGSFENYRSKKIGNGGQEGQFKAPQLTDETDFEKNFSIEEVVSL